jgi:hypothetical protein
MAAIIILARAAAPAGATVEAIIVGEDLNSVGILAAMAPKGAVAGGGCSTEPNCG